MATAYLLPDENASPRNIIRQFCGKGTVYKEFQTVRIATSSGYGSTKSNPLYIGILKFEAA